MIPFPLLVANLLVLLRKALLLFCTFGCLVYSLLALGQALTLYLGRNFGRVLILSFPLFIISVTVEVHICDSGFPFESVLFHFLLSVFWCWTKYHYATFTGHYWLIMAWKRGNYWVRNLPWVHWANWELGNMAGVNRLWPLLLLHSLTVKIYFFFFSLCLLMLPPPSLPSVYIFTAVSLRSLCSNC